VLLGEDVLLSTGDAVEAISASAAIPAILPPVKINGRDLVDGGVLNNTPLSHAVALGAAVVWVLPTRIERAYDSTRRWLSTNQRAAGLASLLAPHRD
jgi:NTE family protein